MAQIRSVNFFLAEVDPENSDLFYGTTATGGGNGTGTIYCFDELISSLDWRKNLPAVDGSGANTNGAYPQCELAIAGSRLWTTCYKGGASAEGTILRIKFDGTNFP